RAQERDEALVEQWLRKDYPKIKALAQREKASDAKLRQQSTNRIGAQHDPKPILDQLRQHGTRPQRESD
ncbi:MAG: hypothetical protein WAU59_10520, partial [Rhodoplanes sp.]